VLRARITDAVEGKPRRLELHALGQKGSNSTTLHLRKIHVLVEPAHHTEADAWVEQLMNLAYPVTKPFRHVLLLVNPVGGKGKARSIVNEQVMPLLEAAGCKVDKMETTHSKHAEEIASTLDVSNYE
jgi:sphingosine kinase